MTLTAQTLDCGYDRDLLDIHLALFKTKHPLQMIIKKYMIYTATTRRDLEDLIELRRHSFFHDFGMTELSANDLFDQYDLMADHVLVRNRETNELIGSYRIICSDSSEKFYSQEQYELYDFLQIPGKKIELSRACTHQNFRNGISLALVWKGLAGYSQNVGAKYMFGCASVKSTSLRLAKSMFWNLYPAHFESDHKVDVLPAYKIAELDLVDDLLPFDLVDDHIPPLLKSYLKAGAKICSEPAFDQVFNCFDFFTVLDLTEVNEQHRQKFFAC